MSGDARVVSEDLFAKQLDVVKDLSRAVMDNATATKGVGETAQRQTQILERMDERIDEGREKAEQGREKAVEVVTNHVSEQTVVITKHMDDVIGKLQFWKTPQWWISMGIIALALFMGSPLAERLFVRAGLLK